MILISFILPFRMFCHLIVPCRSVPWQLHSNGIPHSKNSRPSLPRKENYVVEGNEEKEEMRRRNVNLIVGTNRGNNSSE